MKRVDNNFSKWYVHFVCTHLPCIPVQYGTYESYIHVAHTHGVQVVEVCTHFELCRKYMTCIRIRFISKFKFIFFLVLVLETRLRFHS